MSKEAVDPKVDHLNQVLRAIRNVNKLISHEKDRDELLKRACDLLIETRGYYNAWMALLDESGKYEASYEAGLEEHFVPMQALLEQGKLAVPAKKALTEGQVIAIEDPSTTCRDCPLSSYYQGFVALTALLSHNGRTYGLL